MASSFTVNLSLEKPANGDDVDTWDVPVNGNMDEVDAFAGGVTTINVTSASGTVALTASQYRPRIFVFSGVLTADVNYQLPSGVGGQWSLLNSSSGAHTITFSSAGAGTSITLPQGSRTLAQCDGTNVAKTAAAAGANSDITSLTGLTTPLAVGEGGTGVAAAGGTVYATLADDQTFTGTKSFAGTSSKVAEVVTNGAEVTTVVASGATGTINLYAASQSVLYYTSNASANWTMNLSLSAGTTLNTALSTGQSVTVAFLATQGATPYYASTIQVDGSTSGVTTKWQGGAPVSGNPSGIDVYQFTVTKLGSGTFLVLASQTPYS